ncbi:MAG TPA: amidohydrolase family protein [Candidatus Dormibacteraeota bacterium]|nr:amidohydrolase family protein [Candidatus Dormibacteraeota bacterium]
MASGDLTLRSAAVVDPARESVTGDRRVRIRDGVIRAVEPEDGSSLGEGEIDASAGYLLPGLIDCHVHVISASASTTLQADMYASFVAARAARNMGEMLRRGFTTVRDAAGADGGLAEAVERGLILGPRLIYAGKALSQTGGHADIRPAGRETHDPHYFVPTLGRICDGVDEVRRAARDEIRRGASHIKIMASGGCASPTDRVDSLQFSQEELEAIVEEAAAAGIYCAAHAYTADAVNRSLRAGVRTIEHGNLMDQTSVALFRERSAFLVPTLITYSALVENGAALGLSRFSLEKSRQVYDAGLASLEMADRAGLRIAFGTDLLGDMQVRQSEEFAIRARVQRPADVLRAATTTAAELLRLEGRVGVVAPGAHGDVVLARHNPLDDISHLADPERELVCVVKGGELVVDRRAA